MDVFVIPFGGDRYELYFEQVHESEVDPEPPSSSFFGRLSHRFSVMLRAAEERQRRGHQDESPKGWFAWAQDRMLGWAAERIAEQRLLWNLRKETAALAMHPPDMTFEEARATIGRLLKGDYERHRLWLIIDGVLFIASGALVLIPGPNIVAYYFAFRLVGHYLSMRGAAQGIHRITWSGRACEPLGELRQAVALEPDARQHRVDVIARVLHLRNLPSFYERLKVRHA